MQLFYQENITGGAFDLDPTESHHMVKVLRKSIGDLVCFTNGKGSFFTCKIVDNNPKKCRMEVLEQTFTPRENFHIHLAIAPTKNIDRIEWMLEKITEIGFHEITFLRTTNIERNRINLDRMQKKLVSACKQSCKSWLPTINDFVDYKDFVTDKAFDTYQRFVAYVDKDNQAHLMRMAKPENSYLVLIGPEGDFSPQEISLAIRKGFVPCSLGKHRLRTETAGIVTVHCLNLINL